MHARGKWCITTLSREGVAMGCQAAYFVEGRKRRGADEEPHQIRGSSLFDRVESSLRSAALDIYHRSDRLSNGPVRLMFPIFS